MTINNELTYSLRKHTAYIKINRPPNNYFDAALIESIADILDDLNKEIMCRSIILYSEGKNFCAGADFSKSNFIEGQNMGNVIATSDVCVASAGSTAATVSLIHGKPTVIHDMFYGGKEPRWAKSLICEDGDSLVFRLKNLLKFGIDEKILKTAKWAMHADFDVNSSANTRISNLFENLLATAGEYPDPRNFKRIGSRARK